MISRHSPQFISWHENSCHGDLSRYGIWYSSTPLVQASNNLVNFTLYPQLNLSSPSLNAFLHTIGHISRCNIPNHHPRQFYCFSNRPGGVSGMRYFIIPSTEACVYVHHHTHIYPTAPRGVSTTRLSVSSQYRQDCVVGKEAPRIITCVAATG